MKVFKQIFNIFLGLVVIFLLTATIGSAVTKTPFLMTAVRSNSMYPLYERGDLLLLSPVSDKDQFQIGDIIIFRTDTGVLANQGWIAHRIIGGNNIEGFITKGDANDYTDQDHNSPAIKPEWISNKVITFSGQPLKIPLLGYLPLLTEQYQKNPYVLPAITVILAAIIGISELTENKKKTRRKKNKSELPLMYFLGGITVSILLGASMMATSEHLRIPYEVSETNKGVMTGSLGILKVGEVVERPLSDLENSGFFPITVVLTSNDKQTSFSHQALTLMPGQKEKATLIVTAENPGNYESSIHVGMFFPVLPKALISFLANINYWLAVIVVALIPGLPLMLYPLWDSRMRRIVIKSLNKSMRQVRNSLPVG